MTTNEPVAESSAASWREQAVARSLDSARVRAENRVQRFIDAAFELLIDSEPGKDFTVQDVVEKSGQSLRSFYQYFGGKQELLLALFEESVRSTTDELRNRIQREKKPLDRLHRFVIEYYALCRPTPKGKGKKKAPVALAEFAQQLMTAHPHDEVLDEAVAAGAVRRDLSRRRIAGVVLEAIMFNAFSTTISGSAREPGGRDPAEELWDLLVNGIGS